MIEPVATKPSIVQACTAASLVTRRVIQGLLLLTLVAAGCSKEEKPEPKLFPPRDLFAVYLERMEAMVDTLSKVNDVATARAAAPRLHAIRLAMEQARTEMGKEVSVAERRRISAQHGERLIELTRKLGEQTRRIAADQAISAELQEALKAVPPLAKPARPRKPRLP
jgi:hypothetical protein